MLEKTRYVILSTKRGNEKIGVVTVKYHEGKIGIGVSKCHSSDIFNRALGKKIASERADDMLLNAPLLRLCDWAEAASVVENVVKNAELRILYYFAIKETLDDLCLEMLKYCMRKEYRG